MDTNAMTAWERIQTDAANESIYQLGKRRVLPHQLDDALHRIACRANPERERGDSDDSAPDAQIDSKTAHARSVLETAATAVDALRECADPGLNEVLRLALAHEYLDWLTAEGVLHGGEETSRISRLREEVESIVSRWIEAGSITDKPSAHVRKTLQPLIDVLQIAQRLANARLFVRPENEAAVQIIRKDLSKETADLRKREAEILDLWQKVEADLRRIGITGVPCDGEAVRNRLTREASEQGPDGTAGQTLAKIGELEGRQLDIAGRACQLLDEETRLVEEALRREGELPVQSTISPLDPRRDSVMPGYDSSNIDPDTVKQARAVLSGKLNSFDEELEKLSVKVPDECRDASGDGIDGMFFCLNRVWKLNQRKERHVLLDLPDLCEALFKRGPLYSEIVSDLQEITTSLQSLLDEHALQVRAVQDIKDLIKKGAVFQAEKRMAKIEKKFRGVGYRRCEEGIQEATRPFRDAKRVSSEVDDYLSKRKGLMGKLFKDKETLRRLDSEISRLRSEAAALPKSELRDAITEICQKTESALKA